MASTSNNPEVDPEAEIDHPFPEEEAIEDDRQMSPTNASTKKSHKRKLKSILQDDLTKSSKPDIQDGPGDKPSEIVVEIDVQNSEGQPEGVIEIHTEFELQCRMASLPPDSVNLANCLFAYWEQHLNFYEDVDRTNNGPFARETINELSILVDNATSQHLAQQDYEEEDDLQNPE